MPESKPVLPEPVLDVVRTPSPTPTAPQLYAMALGNPCCGPESCHWCGSPCERRWTHDEPLRLAYRASVSQAKLPSSPWICRGCWFFRMPKVTVRYPDGSFSDNKTPKKNGWLLTEWDAFAVRPEDHEAVWKVLRAPPLRFALVLRKGAETLLHVARVNDFSEIRMETELAFTVDNRPMTYTVYELEEAIKTRQVEGKEPGVRALVEYFGMPPGVVAKKGAGRPEATSAAKTLEKVVRKEE